MATSIKYPNYNGKASDDTGLVDGQRTRDPVNDRHASGADAQRPPDPAVISTRASRKLPYGPSPTRRPTPDQPNRP